MPMVRDCVSEAKRWLRDYGRLTATAENLRDEIATLLRLNTLDVAAPVSKYGDDPGGGTPELTTVESAAAAHIARERRIGELRERLVAIELGLRKVDRALLALAESDRRLVVGHYIEGVPWDVLGRECGYSKDWVRKSGGRALQQFAEVLFGHEGGLTIGLAFWAESVDN